MLLCSKFKIQNQVRSSWYSCCIRISCDSFPKANLFLPLDIRIADLQSQHVTLLLNDFCSVTILFSSIRLLPYSIYYLCNSLLCFLSISRCRTLVRTCVPNNKCNYPLLELAWITQYMSIRQGDTQSTEVNFLWEK